MRVYVDTSVILDYIEQRIGKHGEPLGEYADRFFINAVIRHFEVILSTKVLEELYGHVAAVRTTMLMTWLKKESELKIVKYNPDDLIAAQKLDADNRNDALHALLANRAKADVLVTRNIKDFVKFSFLVKPELPENI
jgi:predicted nucleic acid-binding protein